MKLLIHVFSLSEYFLEIPQLMMCSQSCTIFLSCMLLARFAVLQKNVWVGILFTKWTPWILVNIYQVMEGKLTLLRNVGMKSGGGSNKKLLHVCLEKKNCYNLLPSSVRPSPHHRHRKSSMGASIKFLRKLWIFLDTKQFVDSFSPSVLTDLHYYL